MKTAKKILSSLSIALFVTIASSYAQDPVKVAPNVYKKVILNNEKVRVIELEFAPGDSTAWHRHPNHVVYALTAGKLQITEKGKAPVVVEIKAGEAVYMSAVVHMAKNIGTLPVKLVVTEIKPSKIKKIGAMPPPADN
jgi:beta-alanine degradation protein BauB